MLQDRLSQWKVNSDSEKELKPNRSDPVQFDDFQRRASEYRIYPQQFALIYPLLGLLSEVGEVIEHLLRNCILPNGAVESTLLDSKHQGEIAGRLKKYIRDGHGLPNGDENTAIPAAILPALDTIKKSKLVDEVGDCVWYLAAICSDLGISFSRIVEDNLAKLASRKQRGVLKGSGDSR